MYMYEPQIVTYAVAGRERNGEQRKTKVSFHDASNGVAVVGEKACLRMKRC